MAADSQTDKTVQPSSAFLSLSAEIRLQIYAELVTEDFPFLIGRCQDKSRKNRRRKDVRSPRDMLASRRLEHIPPRRDDRMYRPLQPPIARVCRLLREESLPVFYGENRFWLIHNEFTTREETDEIFMDLDSSYHKAQGSLYPATVAQPTVSTGRGFAKWLAQTPRRMFDIMQHVSICGYGEDWPIRYMISLDLKEREVLNVKRYTTYGDEPYSGVKPAFRGELQAVLSEKEKERRDGLETLEVLLSRLDWMFEIPSWQEDDIPEGYDPERLLGEGWEFEW